ncbi:hypothetical protein Cadr_000008934 [Camelus dromedarius]|uniref:Uncharacterized protein n=1 Tax=Camelus dromedarius TaxID=9838 RepID=A0A5N4DJE4_CAMDR|nr:hypothetical protein Cadr_000008934 [Camelus dromedarius]
MDHEAVVAPAVRGLLAKRHCSHLYAERHSIPELRDLCPAAESIGFFSDTKFPCQRDLYQKSFQKHLASWKVGKDSMATMVPWQVTRCSAFGTMSSIELWTSTPPLLPSS